MAEGQTMVFARASTVSTDGVISVGRHTSQIAFMNQTANFAQIKLNGKFVIAVGPGPNGDSVYTHIDGDYVNFEVLTANTTISTYALG